MNILLRAIPFIVVIGLNVLAQASRYKINMLMPYILIALALLTINLLILLVLKKKDYFAFGISGVAITGLAAVFVLPQLGQFYIKHIIEGLYLGLFLMASIPLIIRIKPFCFSISEKDYPPVIVRSKSFLKINYVMSALWAVLFLLSIVFTIIHYSNDTGLQTIIAMLVPILIQVCIGIPLTKFLPDYLTCSILANGV